MTLFSYRRLPAALCSSYSHPALISDSERAHLLYITSFLGAPHTSTSQCHSRPRPIFNPLPSPRWLLDVQLRPSLSPLTLWMISYRRASASASGPSTVYYNCIHSLPVHIRCCMRYPLSLRIASRRAFSLAKCAGMEGSDEHEDGTGTRRRRERRGGWDRMTSEHRALRYPLAGEGT
jgi:hypothetical protein